MRFIIVLAATLLASPMTFADSSTGCGLGSLIWKNNSLISGLFRFTTNHSFSSQLFGITSGTSGCSQHSIVKREMYPVYYAEANLPELKHEIAMGNGEYLATFAQVLGCTGQGASDFARWSKDSYPLLFSHEQTTSKEFLSALKVFKATNSGSCTNMAVI